MDYSVSQTQSQVNAAAETLKQKAENLRNRITDAKQKITTEATVNSEATFMHTFDADFTAYLNSIENQVNEIIEIAEKMKNVAAIQQKASETEIQH